MLRKALIVMAPLWPLLGCNPEAESDEAIVQIRRTEAAGSAWGHRIDPRGGFGALVLAASESARLDDEQWSLVERTLDDFGQAQKQHAVTIAVVHAALADGVETCDFDRDDVAAATASAAASALRLGTAEAEAIDALHEILRPTQRIRVVREALEEAHAAPAPRRSLIRSLARLVELSDEQVLAAADNLDTEDFLVEEQLLPPDPTERLEAFSRRSFSAAEFGLGIDTLARTEAHGAWLISSLEVFCPVLDADQRAVLTDGLLEPLTAASSSGPRASHSKPPQHAPD